MSDQYSEYIKRILDLIIIFPVFIISIPVNFFIGIITFFDVGIPIFFRQERTGKNGKHFYLVKFRNMTNDKDEFGNLLPPSQRVTRFGKFVRKYSLDELLYFWSILKGDMSIIGPRPLPSSFDERYSERHKMRTAVRPGLECPSLEAGHHVRLYQEQFENDIWYVENISFVTDVKMILALIRMVFNSNERDDHASVFAEKFILILGGEDFHKAAISARILALRTFLSPINAMLLLHYLIPKKKEKEAIIISAIAAASNVVLNYFLIPLHGAVGASLAIVAAEAIEFVFLFFYIRKYMSFRYAFSGISQYCLCVIPVVFIAYCASKIIRNNYISITAGVLLSVPCYLLFLWMMRNRFVMYGINMIREIRCGQ